MAGCLQMACLTDIPRVMRSVGPLRLAARVWREINDDDLLTWAAAMAYSWLFAIFPFLIFLLSLLPYMPVAVKDRINTELRTAVFNSIPQEAAQVVWDNISFLINRRHTGLMGIGALFTLWAASGGISMSMAAIEKCYELRSTSPIYIQRPKAVLLTLVVAVLTLFILALLPLGTVAIAWVRQHAPEAMGAPLVVLWRQARFPVALLLMFIVVHVLYQYGPAIRQRWTFITPGAVFCVGMWVAMGMGFRFYVERFGKFNETYGTVGGVAVLLLLFYLYALVLLAGAEINSEIDFEITGAPRGSTDFRIRRAAAPAPPPPDGQPA